MEKRKLKIAEFIESLNDGKISSSTVLLGGAKIPYDEVMTSKNSSDCKNDIYDCCNKSTNEGNCINTSGKCNSTTNRGSCDNSYRPAPENIANCMCTS